jgi:adenylate cyclase
MMSLGSLAMEQEQPVRVGRRLAAIVAADVAGYSRLMGLEEKATHAKLTALLIEAVYPAIAEHGGRIVKNTADGFLAEFPSVVEAVRAAMQFQPLIHELTVNQAQDNRIAFRVGINIGDVIVEPHDIFGDGVNLRRGLRASQNRVASVSRHPLTTKFAARSRSIALILASRPSRTSTGRYVPIRLA